MPASGNDCLDEQRDSAFCSLRQYFPRITVWFSCSLSYMTAKLTNSTTRQSERKWVRCQSSNCMFHRRGLQCDTRLVVLLFLLLLETVSFSLHSFRSPLCSVLANLWRPWAPSPFPFSRCPCCTCVRVWREIILSEKKDRPWFRVCVVTQSPAERHAALW